MIAFFTPFAFRDYSNHYNRNNCTSFKTKVHSTFHNGLKPVSELYSMSAYNRWLSCGFEPCTFNSTVRSLHHRVSDSLIIIDCGFSFVKIC